MLGKLYVGSNQSVDARIKMSQIEGITRLTNGGDVFMSPLLISL